MSRWNRARLESSYELADSTGISADQLPHVFDRFSKGESSSGSGLGLTIARNLVEGRGGTIRAESRQGAGTTMTLSLPR